MKTNLQLAAERLSNVAGTCEIVQGSVTLAGTDMREHAADIRTLINAAESLPTGTELEVCRDIAARQSHGQRKYGTTVAENPLKIEQWAQHAYEEALDFPIYLKRLIGEALAMRLRLEQLQSQDAEARDALRNAGFPVLRESQAPADGIRAMAAKRESLVIMMADLKRGIRKVGDNLHEITSFAENEKTMAIAHGLYDTINTILASTPAEAGAELERLREALSLLSTLNPIMAVGIDQPMHAARAVVAYVTAERNQLAALRADLVTVEETGRERNEVFRLLSLPEGDFGALEKHVQEVADLRTQLNKREEEYLRGTKMLAENGTEWARRAEEAEAALIGAGWTRVPSAAWKPPVNRQAAEANARSFMPPLPAGVEDTPELRAELHATCLRSEGSGDAKRPDTVRLAALEAEISEARRAWIGDDFGHLPLKEAIGAMREVYLARAERAERAEQRLGELGVTPDGVMCDLAGIVRRQRAFSERTFGPNPRTFGILEHIRKELVEIEAKPHDLSEWIDVVILALDGAWRHRGTPETICATLVAKLAKNERRTWPDWRTVSDRKAICHVRTAQDGTE